MVKSDSNYNDCTHLLKVAEHILLDTYPVIRNPKLFLAIAEDIYSALISAVEFEFPGDCSIDDKISKFGKKFSHLDVCVILKLKSLLEEHKKSPLEFTRNGQFIICDENYNFTKISDSIMKKYLFEARLLIEGIRKEK